MKLVISHWSLVIGCVFPLKTYLHIWQLEQYDIGGFLRWWLANPLTRKIGEKKPLVWTLRLLITFITVITFITIIAITNFWLGLLMVFFPLPPILVAGIISSPFIWVSKMWINAKIKRRIKLLKQTNKLVVIAVSGSYGKTSVKEYLYQILSMQYRVVRPPESYNTLLGIAKVVDLEVDKTTQVFICEMGAFRRGEVKRLCEMVLPDYALLTGLNEQHLEKFGSLENEILGESESLEYVLAHGGKVVANFGNEIIKSRFKNRTGVIGYGEGRHPTPMVQNIAGAKMMAGLLGVNHLPQNLHGPKHRLSLIKRGEITIIDDAYSSNTDGFRAAIDYLTTFPDWKVVVTPGIVELGNQTARIHQELGQFMQGKVNQVILVGKNARTESLAAGYGGQVEYTEDVSKAMGLVEKRPAVVLFENDLPDNY